MKYEFYETSKCWDETVMPNMQFLPGRKTTHREEEGEEWETQVHRGCDEGYPKTAPLLVETLGTVISISIYFCCLESECVFSDVG